MLSSGLVGKGAMQFTSSEEGEMKRYLLFMVIGLSLAGCATPLQKYIKAHKYEPFAIPRSDDGIGIIITFRDGAESLVAARSECFPKESVPGADPLIRVALEEETYEIKDSDGVELNLAKAIANGVDLKAAFNYAQVKKVRISFLEPFEDRISEISVEKHAKTLAGECLKAILAKDDYVINRVLGAKGIAYTFLSENNSKLTLDANILNQISLEPSLQRQYTGKTDLSAEFPILIGYRLLRPQISPGLTSTELSFRALEPSEVKGLKAKR